MLKQGTATHFTLVLFLCLIAIVCQIGIVIYWETAKYWTVVNLLFAIYCIVALGRFYFYKMVRNEVAQLFTIDTELPNSILTQNEIAHLPIIVQKWLHNSGVIGKDMVQFVKLTQQGEMRTKPTGSWMPFQATQYFNVLYNSFVWVATIRAMPFLRMFGRDMLSNGAGAMLIKLNALITVVHEQNHHKINTGAMIRYLAEICWFPTAAVQEAIAWEPVSDTSAKAILTIGNTSVSGIFNFTESGEITSFEALRFYGGDEDSKQEKWCIEMLSHKSFEGINIPNKSKVIWKLPTGDFHWLTVEITSIKYDD
jgi:hypothetical protein